MYNYEIEEYFKKCDHFIGVFPRDKLPNNIPYRPCGLIINTDKARDPGTHWVAICLLKHKKGEYFDSFGLPPLQEEIRFFLDKNCSNGWFFNATTLQHPLTSSCGLYTIAFLYNRFNNISFRKFISGFSPNIEKNEGILKERLEKHWFHNK